MDTIRTFVALPLSLEAREKLETALAPMMATHPDLRWTPPTQWHITLRFFGKTPTADIPALTANLKAIAKNFSSILVTFGELGAFPDWQKTNSIWIAAEGRLKTLQSEIASLAHSNKDTRIFTPHVTLARTKEALPRLALPEMERFRWIADRVILYQSETKQAGSVYTPIATCPL